MSASAAVNPGISERRVRREVRSIVEGLDRKVDALQTTLGCTALLLPVGLFPYFWKLQEMVWWKSALCAVGGGLALLMVAAIASVGMESRLAGKAVRRFNLRFPERSPHRLLAEALLADVEPRCDGVKSFLAQVVTPGQSHVMQPSRPETAEPVWPRPEPPSSPRAPSPPPALPNQAIPLELPGEPRDGEA